VSGNKSAGKSTGTNGIRENKFGRLSEDCSMGSTEHITGQCHYRPYTVEGTPWWAAQQMPIHVEYITHSGGSSLLPQPGYTAMEWP
jgi:hypothetical protein